jgi:predicted PurR-regulated permease PerM
MPIELTAKQGRVVAVAATTLSVLVIVGAFGFAFYGVSVFLRTFSGVFLPLAFASVLALVVKPYYNWFVRRGLRPGLAVTLVLLSALLPIAAGLFFFGRLLVIQIQELILGLPEWWATVRAWIDAKVPEVTRLIDRFDLEEKLRAALAGSQEAILSGLQSVGGGAFAAGARFLGVIGHLLSWLVVPVYFAFLLMLKPPERPGETLLPFLKPETRDDVLYLARELLNIVVTFFRGQLIVAFLLGVLLAIGFTLVGLRYGFLIGLVLGFLNIVPYLGSMVGLAVCLPLAFFQQGGGLTKMLMVLAVFAVVQFIEGHFLTPQIMGKRTGLHPLVIIVSFFFWSEALNGILGMILAVPLTAFLVVVWRLMREKYIAELV